MRGDIEAWGLRRKQVDMDKLALAYYLLARSIIEEQKTDNNKLSSKIVDNRDRKAA
jgi:hypothetical protein